METAITPLEIRTPVLAYIWNYLQRVDHNSPAATKIREIFDQDVTYRFGSRRYSCPVDRSSATMGKTYIWVRLAATDSYILPNTYFLYIFFPAFCQLGCGIVDFRKMDLRVLSAEGAGHLYKTVDLHCNNNSIYNPLRPEFTHVLLFPPKREESMHVY
jgi:hypothetical protein